MGRRLRWGAVLVAVLLTVACTAQPDSSSVRSGSPSARLLAGNPLVACSIKGESPVKAEAPALCGTLRVPEDRSHPGGRQIDLRVAVLPAVTADHQREPLFGLAGGPGEASTQFFAWLPSVFEVIHATRDIVLVDQRGTGGSNALNLPQMPDTTGLSDSLAEVRLTAWAHDALAAIDADPRYYTSTIAADDLDDVRAALGYQRIDLYGASYGGTLAQYYLRQHGDRVRAAVLDGSTPIDVPVLERIAASSQAALDLLFRRCAEDPACEQAFPRLADEWRAVVERLSTPLTITDPASAATAVIDQAMLAAAIHLALLTQATAVQIPLVVHLAYQGKWVEAAHIISAPSTGGQTLLMADEILCSEAWARLDPAEVARLGAGGYALPRELANAKGRALMCRYLPQGVAPPNDSAAVRTAAPVLWLVGDGDPQDPPSNLASVPDQQPNSRIVVMPAQEHVVGHLGCLPSVIAAFLDAGTVERLDTSCVAQGAPTPPFRLN